MKRLALSALAVLGALLLGGNPAHAQNTPIQTITKGGVTCSQWNSGQTTFPLTYWDCVNPSAPTGEESTVPGAANQLQTSPTNLKASLTNVQIYIFQNATAYHNYTGATAPAANAFGATTTNLAAVFASATQNGAVVDLTSEYEGSIMQELGHLVDATQTSPFSSNAVFTTALAYDEAYMDAQGTVVWPSAYYTKYSGKTNWQIFQAIYPNAATDIFDYQFMINTGHGTNNDLEQVLNTYMPNTKGWVQNYVFLATPVNAAVAKNGVLCVQQHPGYTTFPTSYWDCVDPYNPTGNESTIAGAAVTLQTAPNNLKTPLANVQIYAFTNGAAFASFTGATAPAANAFGATTANLAAAFASATQNGAVVDLTSTYGQDILIELGHLIDVSLGNYSAQPLFAFATAYDLVNLNAQGNTVWPAAYYTKYPNMTNWQILGQVYSNADVDIFSYQFAKKAGFAQTNGLAQALSAMPNSFGLMSNYVFGPLVNQAKLPQSGTNIMCVQQSSGQQTFPLTFWDCIHPYNPTGEESSGANAVGSLPLALRTIWANNSVNIYDFEDSSDFNNFFTQNVGNTAILGATFYAPTRVSAAFATTLGGSPPTPQDLTNYYPANTIHELGHQLDQIWGRPSGTNANWLAAIAADQTTFNALPCAQAIDSTGTTTYCTQYAGLTNWAIFTTKLINTSVNTLDQELWAIAFQAQSGFGTLPVFQNIEQNLTAEKTYMQTHVYANGAP